MILTPPVSDGDLDALAALLLDAVAGGASVSFMSSLGIADARDWWRRTLDDRPATLFVARDEAGVIVGCVRFIPARAPNQPHRADVAKLLVHRRARRRGLARALMLELEQHAWTAGFGLLTLDTRRGDAAEALYRAAGWTQAGIVPDYALDPSGTLCDTVLFYKSAWPSRRELNHLVDGFTHCTLRTEQWTHRAHLAVGTWHIATYGADEALNRLRTGIQRLNVLLGAVNSDTNGYHETITRAYVDLIARFLTSRPAHTVDASARSLLASPLAAPDVLRRFYSTDVLMSVAARRSWVAPDITPIALDGASSSA